MREREREEGSGVRSGVAGVGPRQVSALIAHSLVSMARHKSCVHRRAKHQTKSSLGDER